jgi:hypothetical protein
LQAEGLSGQFEVEIGVEVGGAEVKVDSVVTVVDGLEDVTEPPSKVEVSVVVKDR